MAKFSITAYPLYPVQQYSSWSQGLSIMYDKKYIACAVATTLANNEIGSVMIAASIVALAVRFGVNIFCEMFEPDTIMDHNVKEKKII